MRFERLHLRQYGAFLDESLEFRPGARLHVVYGPNGAGKTTVLGALRSALFGIGPKEKAFRYPSANRRLGVSLRAADGRRLEYLRRSSNQSPLWTPDDGEPLDVAELRPFLGGLDAETYGRLFGLDLEELRAGGNNLIERKAELGDALFSAALGAERLARVRGALREERAALFLPRRQGTFRIAELLDEHTKLRAELAGAIRSRDDLKRTRARLASLEERAETLQRERVELEERSARASRLAAAARELLRRGQLTAQRDELGGGEGALEESVARLSAELEGDRNRATAEERALGEEERGLGEEIAAAEERLREAGGPAAGGRLGEDPGAARDSLHRKVKALEAARDARARAETALGTSRAEVLEASDSRSAVEERARELWPRDFDALLPFAGGARELRGLEAPSARAMEELVRRDALATQAAVDAEEALRHHRDEVEAAAAAVSMARGAAGGDVPGPEDVARARRERDAAVDRALAGGAPGADEALGVVRSVEAADRLVDRRLEAGAREAELRAAEQELAAAQARVVRSEASAAAAQASLDEVRDEVLERAAPLGLGGLAAPDLAAWCTTRSRLLERIADEIERAVARRRELEERAVEARAALEIAERELERAEGALAEWATAHGLDPDLDPAAMDAALREREARDIEVRERSEALDRGRSALTRTRERRAAATARREEATARLTELAVVHAGGDLALLAERAQRAGELRRLRSEIAAIDERLTGLCPGEEPEDILAAVGDRDVASLEGEASAAGAELDRVRAEREALGEELGRARLALEGGGDDGAVVAARIAQVEAELADGAERYATLTVAEHLLEREVRRYRESTQGPLLRRAEELFRRLTVGAFTGLRTDELKGDDVLVGVRPGGEAVPVGEEGMSEGTADQLYLALRIATVEASIRGVEPMPFLADDLFTTFDDDRARAGLEVLAELGESTQVIVFTHHLPLLEAARSLGLGEALDVIELDAEVEREARQAP